MDSNFLLFQMGKVGSSSLRSALSKAGLPVLQTHSASVAGEFYLNQVNPVVITATRDLLERTISAFFQNLCNRNNTYWYLGEENDLQDLTIEELISQFKQRAPRHMEELILPWFDNFAKIIGFDVFQTPFDHQKGYQHYRLHSGNDLFLYRYENLVEFVQELGNYCGNSIQLERINCSKNKWYSSYYSAFKNDISFTSDEGDYYYHNHIMKHFYNHLEIENMRAKWFK